MAENSRASFSPESLGNLGGQPVRVTLNSQEVGWRSLLLVRKQSAINVEGYESPLTRDQQVIVVTKGTCEFEAFANGRWRDVPKLPGECATTAPLNSIRSRWRFANEEEIELVDLYLPQVYFEEAADEYHRVGRAVARIHVDARFFYDSTVFQIATSLTKAVSLGYLDMYADTAARYLATHMLATANEWPKTVFNRNIGRLSDKRLARVADYARHHFSEAITTQGLAKLAGISPFHFARLFKQKMGCTPHQYIRGLRMQHARTLLSTRDRKITEISLNCGYSNASHFAASFLESFGQSPAAYRDECNLSPARGDNADRL